MSLGLRHLHRRNKAGFKHALDILIYPAAVIAPLALLPQVWQVFSTHDVSSLSLPTWVVLGFINFLWIFYGWAHRERPIMLTHAAFCILNFAIAGGILLYR